MVDSNTTDQVEARPIGQGKDPLAEGNTLANPTNSEAETHYDVKEKSEDVQAASQIAGQDANERAEEHNAQTAVLSDVPNSDAAEQDQVAEGRTEEATAPELPADETPAEESVETPAEEAAEPSPETPVDESPAEEAVETPTEEASEPAAPVDETAPAVPSEADLDV